MASAQAAGGSQNSLSGLASVLRLKDMLAVNAAGLFLPAFCYGIISERRLWLRCTIRTHGW